MLGFQYTSPSDTKGFFVVGKIVVISQIFAFLSRKCLVSEYVYYICDIPPETYLYGTIGMDIDGKTCPHCNVTYTSDSRDISESLVPVFKTGIKSKTLLYKCHAIELI